jgi:hypothetical protein
VFDRAKEFYNSNAAVSLVVYSSSNRPPEKPISITDFVVIVDFVCCLFYLFKMTKKWRNSSEKEQLRKDIVNGVVGEDMDANIV